ncbi:MAG: DUF72 domain-containing protein [Melioribacteraceae bacterium]|nr:DUF72 domain-containing protein [Melioribacteraceae bacterium]
MAELRIGTCSWKYDSWKGIVYSNSEEINYLNEYSQFYNSVEIDQWFWSLHAENKITLPFFNVVNSYKNSVPEDFKFTVKVPNSITLTHFYKKQKSDPLIENKHFFSNKLFDEFLRTLNPIKKQLGPLIFQFEYLNKQKMPAQQHFFGEVEKFASGLDKDYQYSFEIRNPNYLSEEYFNLLAQNNLGVTFIQGYFMPSIIDLYGKYKSQITSTTVIRLHGPDRKGIENKTGGNWDKIVEPKDSELPGIVKIIEDLLSKEVDVYLNVNNHYEGCAPLTIKKIEKMIYGE